MIPPLETAFNRHFQPLGPNPDHSAKKSAVAQTRPRTDLMTDARYAVFAALRLRIAAITGLLGVRSGILYRTATA